MMIIGAVLVYKKRADIWTKVAELVALDYHAFNDTWLQQTVDVSENMIVIGNPSYNVSLGTY